MQRQTRREVGKLAFDLAKILLAIGVLSPIFKEEAFSRGTLIVAATLVILLIIGGIRLIEKGAGENE